jgi:hypothetical protein
VLGPVLALLALLGALVAVRRTRRDNLPARTVIVSPRRSTVIDERGSVRSVQSAEVTMSSEDLERLWIPANLQNLGRTYWLFLSRATLGLVRVVYGAHERSVVLLGRPLTLLRFDAPQYTIDTGRGYVRWRIKDGLLVARAGRGSGWLALDVRRLESDEPGRAMLRIEVEVANFYPAIAARFSKPVYRATQSFVHVLVTHAFLRSLATLDLAQSRVGPFAIASGPIADAETAGNGAGARST